MAFALSLSAQQLRPAATRLHARPSARAAPRRAMETRAALNNEAVHVEAARAFLGKDAQVTFAPTSGGVNNVVLYCNVSDGRRYILRVYNNGNNMARVRFEHAVLAELAKVKHTLSFAVPTTLPAIGTGASHVALSNGAEASMFELIPGVLPKLTHVRAIGKATGELATAMYNIKLDMESPTAPYYDIFRVHHAVTRDGFYKAVAGSAFDGVAGARDYLVEQLRSVEVTIKECHDLNLPFSLIHGDLHYDNVLVESGKVSGLLDMEFSAKDWRAMEIAICLSKYVGEPEPMPYLRDFIEGYAEHGVLTPAEIKAVPALINLRVLSNVVYFVGRAAAGEDSIESLTSRAESYAARVRWVNANGPLICDLLTNAILAPAGAR